MRKSRVAQRQGIFLIAALCTLLIVADIALAPTPRTLIHAIAGHTLAIAAVWTAAVLLARSREDAEAEARRRAAQSEATLAAIADGIVVYNSDGAIVDMNAAARSMFEYTDEELALPFQERMRRRQVSLADDRSDDPNNLPAMRALHGETVIGETVTMQCDGRDPVYLSASAAPVRDGEGRLTGAVASFVDLTARRALEDELRSAQEWLRNEAAVLDGRVRERTAELEAANQALAETGEQLRASWEQTQAFTRRLVEAVENERKAIARELHDQSAQSLTSLMMGLGLLQRHADCTPELHDRLETLKDQVDAIMGDLHRLSKDLRPAALDRLGLAPAVRQYAEAFGSEHGLEVQFEATGVDEDGNTPPELKTALYRIVQEALTNVARHAQATRVAIMLQQTDECAMAIIEDDGIGFDATQAANKERLGLLGMRERVELLGGRVQLESSAGKGTTIIASVPVPATNGQLA